MIRKLVIFLVLFLLTCSPSNAVEIVPISGNEYLTCYDYSVSFAAENPDWGIVTVSNNQLFKGVTHCVNYQIVNEYTLKIHDGVYDEDYLLVGWQEAGYYHFWVNEVPTRNYRTLSDNREEILN